MTEETKKERRGNFIPEETRREIYETILEKLAIGFIDHEIRRHIQKEYGITYTTANTYIKRVRAQLKENQAAIQNDEDLNLSMAIIRLETLYRKAIEDGKLDVAERVMRQLNQLLGLNVTPNVPGTSVYINNSSPSLPANVSQVPTKVLEAEYHKSLNKLEDKRDIPSVMTTEFAKKLVEGKTGG